jgi:DNA-binding transcriptional regulator YiaG
MSKIASVFKEEITRLARKETKTQTQVLRKANVQYRHDIAQLKRQVDALSKQVSFLQQQERKRTSAAVAEGAAEGKRFSKRGLATHRRKLGLSAADYATLVGVSAQTIYNWELGKSKPREQQLAALVAVRQLGKREALKRLELLEG